MPEMDGGQLTKQLNYIRPDIKILFMKRILLCLFKGEQLVSLDH